MAGPPDGLTGNYLVKIYEPALDEARDLLPKDRDFYLLREHALKLRYWPEQNPEDESGNVLDLDWSYIHDSGKIGELRIHETIAGNDNLRIIFFVGEEDDRFPMRVIWILMAFQKKRQDFSKAQKTTFQARRRHVETLLRRGLIK